MSAMIKISACGRKAMEKLSRLPFADNVAVISITDCGYPPVTFENEPRHLLRLSFNDKGLDDFWDEENAFEQTEKEEYEARNNVISQKQAADIAEFYFKTVDNGADTVICQCEQGMSRSAAVMAAILEYEYQRGIEVFSDKRSYPNKTVFKRVLKALISAKGSPDTLRLLPLTEE